MSCDLDFFNINSHVLRYIDMLARNDIFRDKKILILRGRIQKLEEDYSILLSKYNEKIGDRSNCNKNIEKNYNKKKDNADNRKKFCTNCGAEMSIKDEICQKCSTLCSGEAKRCRYCGTMLDLDDIFCTECGKCTEL